MAPKGQFLGIDIDDSAYVPVASAQQLFDQDGLWEIDLLFSPLMESSVVENVRRILMERHDGEEDFAITTQNDALAVMDRVLGIVSLAVGAIGAISLVVGAIGILTMMWISVNERTPEIGLSKAIGASSSQILALHLAEAMLLSVAGGAIGVAVGLGTATVLRWIVPGLPVNTPVRYVFAALGVSLLVGLASGALPALRASRLDPVEALRAE
jgi:putative ABC transport system permease protein